MICGGLVRCGLIWYNEEGYKRKYSGSGIVGFKFTYLSINLKQQNILQITDNLKEEINNYLFQ